LPGGGELKNRSSYRLAGYGNGNDGDDDPAAHARGPKGSGCREIQRGNGTGAQELVASLTDSGNPLSPGAIPAKVKATNFELTSLSTRELRLKGTRG